MDVVILVQRKRINFIATIKISVRFCAEIFPYRLLGAGAYLDGGPARHLLLDGEQGHGHQLCNTG